MQDESVVGIVIVCHDGNLRSDLHAVADAHASDGHDREAVVHEHIASQPKIATEVHLKGRENVSMPLEWTSEELLDETSTLVSIGGRCLVDSETQQASPLKFLNRWSVLRRAHIHGLAGGKPLEDVCHDPYLTFSE